MVARRRCARQWRCWTRTARACVTSPSRYGRWWSRRMGRVRRPCDAGDVIPPRHLTTVFQIARTGQPRRVQSSTSSRADPSVQMPACLHTVDRFVPGRSVSANARVSSYSRQLRPGQIRQCRCPRVFTEQCSSTGALHHCTTVCCCACTRHTCGTMLGVIY